MNEQRRYKEPISKKVSRVKIPLLIISVVLLSGFLIWLNVQPKSIEETVEEPETKNEEVVKEVVQQPDRKPTVKPKETREKEGKVTYVNPTTDPESKPETTEPSKSVVIVERVEERDEQSILASALPKVYTIYTGSQQGSGFLYNNSGDIVTNAHVVAGYSSVTVMNNTGQEFVGRVIGISDIIDIALIRVDEIAGKEPMMMDLMKTTEGTNVFAIGSPYNKANTATKGKITGTGREFKELFTYTDLYEIDAPIAPGSSGGPLLDALTEKVVGINSVILTDNPAIGYSIPLYSVYQQLKSWEENPLVNNDPYQPPIKDAHFDEELLSVFIEGYTALYTYAQNEAIFGYLEGYLLPDTEVYKNELEKITNLKDSGKVFTVKEFKVNEVKIEDERALVTATTTTVMEKEGQEPVETKERAVFEVIIDEYGDYMIREITKTDITASEKNDSESTSDAA